MIITCPNCGTNYTVGDQAIKPKGRTVRCTSCATKWHEPGADDFQMSGATVLVDEPRPELLDFHDTPAGETNSFEPLPDGDEPEHQRYEAEDAETEAELTASLKPERSERVPSVTNAKGSSSRITAGMLAASLLAIVGGLVAARSTTEAVWPASARLYQLVHLDPELAGKDLELHDVHSVLRDENGSKTLTIDGMIKLASKDKRTIPTLDAVVSNDGKVLRKWNFNSGVTALGPMESARFSTTLDAADVSVGNLYLTFSAKNSDVAPK